MMSGLCSNILSLYVALRIVLKEAPTIETIVLVPVSQVWTFKTMLPILFAVFNTAAINNLVRERFSLVLYLMSSREIFNYSL